MAIRRSPSQPQLHAFQSRLQKAGPAPLERTEVEALQQDFAALSPDERSEAMRWVAQVRPSLARILQGA